MTETLQDREAEVTKDLLATDLPLALQGVRLSDDSDLGGPAVAVRVYLDARPWADGGDYHREFLEIHRLVPEVVTPRLSDLGEVRFSYTLMDDEEIAPDAPPSPGSKRSSRFLF